MRIKDISKENRPRERFAKDGAYSLSDEELSKDIKGIINKESETVEFKESLTQLKKGIISVASILNKHKKGKIIFGIIDNGSVKGVTVGKDTLRDVSKAISDHIEPKIYPLIKEETIEGKHCVAVDFSGKNTPYYAYGRAYIRTADEDKVLSGKALEEFILNKNKNKFMWDKDICKDAKLSDISAVKIRQYVLSAELRYTAKKDILENLELIRDNRLTNGSVVLFGKNPSKFFRLLNLRCATFLGTDTASQPLDMTDFDGDLFELISFAENYIIQHINVGMRLKGLVRIDIPEINQDAFREAIINAFCHRDYSMPQEINVAVFKDRVEIRNPGGLCEGLTIKDILTKKVSKRRNVLIADVFHRVHLVEKWGTGIGKIKSLEPCAKFEEFSGFFSVTFKRKNKDVGNVPGKHLKWSEKWSERWSELSEREQQILNLIIETPKISRSQLSEDVGINPSAIQKHITKLKKKHILKRIGPDKGGHWDVVK